MQKYILQHKFFKNDDEWTDYLMEYTVYALAYSDYLGLKEQGGCYGYRILQVLEETIKEENA